MKEMSSAARNSISITGTRYTIPGYFFDGHTEMDWKRLGREMTRKLTEEVASANAVDFRYGQESSVRQKKGPKCSWEYVEEEHDVMVFIKKSQHDSHRLCFMGRGVIDKPLEEVAGYIRKVDNNIAWDNFLVEAKYLKTLSETPVSAEYIGYQRFETKKCLLTTKRDMLYFATCSLQRNRYIQGGISIEDPEYPCPSGLKRIEVRPGSGWIMDKFSDTKTLVTYVGNIDLKGLPIFIMNLVLKRHPYAVHYIRRQLIDPSLNKKPKELTRSGDSSQSPDLPEDFAPESNDSGLSDSYEQSIPIEHFLKLN